MTGAPRAIVPCRSCGAPIYFELTKNGKQMPRDADTGESHFATCPQAQQWRRRDNAPIGTKRRR